MIGRRMLAVFGVFLVLALAFFLINQRTLCASECRIIRIIAFASYQNVTLEPKIMHANKGDCLIWFNNAGHSDVKISFEEGKKCTDVADETMDFELNKENCLVTKTYIPPRGTVSFVFEKEGSFEYIVEVKGTNLKVKGTVRVR
jgi:hypothetical protein